MNALKLVCAVTVMYVSMPHHAKRANFTGGAMCCTEEDRQRLSDERAEREGWVGDEETKQRSGATTPDGGQLVR